jgi:hypothetical protein
VPLTDSMIAYWELEEASGQRSDAHGTNHLSVVNAVGRLTGRVGFAADFELSSTQYLEADSETPLRMGDNDRTICAWVNLESKSGNMSIVSKDTDSPGSSRDFTLDYALSSTKFRFYINGGGGADTIVSSEDVVNPSLSTWYFLVAWHNAAADTLNLQINNGTVNSHTTNGTVPQTSTAPFRIGARAYAGFEDYFDGLIDQVGIWNRVLTTDERTSLYNGGNGLAYSAIGGSDPRTDGRLVIQGST